MRLHAIKDWKVKGSIVQGMWELWTKRGGTWYLHEVSKDMSDLIKIAKTL